MIYGSPITYTNKNTIKKEITHKLKIISSNQDKIKLKITSSLDPKLYDQPLTIKTVDPENWQKCTVSQGSRILSNDVKNGIVQYDAIPNGSEIIITGKKS
ncbi:MAG: hypothetical protein PF692_11495 [Kiritimatiellae bacterium]|nr:hypothetical protein [Kiritimatiellia bacterium]